MKHLADIPLCSATLIKEHWPFKEATAFQNLSIKRMEEPRLSIGEEHLATPQLDRRWVERSTPEYSLSVPLGEVPPTAGAAVV